MPNEELSREQFTFYSSFFRAIRRIKKKADRAEAYDAICEYALCGTEPNMDELSDAAAIAFELVKPNLDASRKRAESGRRGGSKTYVSLRKDRNSKEYRTWRNAVFLRDNYTCQMCGQRGGKLNAHHIERYRNNIERRTDVSNGITLCESCHKKLHREEGI